MTPYKSEILVVFYSAYDDTFRMADAGAEGVSEAGGETILKQVAELVTGEFWSEAVR